jgi:hypothetical protein
MWGYFYRSERQNRQRVSGWITKNLSPKRHVARTRLCRILLALIEEDMLLMKTSVLRHRKGVAAEEKAFGADILIHVALKAADLEYSKGVLVQAKNFDRHLFARERQRFVDRCDKMLVVTPASFVFGYSRRGMRCGSAVTMVSTTSPALFEQCVWTSYRFFLELFRCPIGDRRITSANVADLPVPNVIRIRGSGGGAET